MEIKISSVVIDNATRIGVKLEGFARTFVRADLDAFLLHLIKDKNASESHQNQHACAIKLYYSEICQQEEKQIGCSSEMVKAKKIGVPYFHLKCGNV